MSFTLGLAADLIAVEAGATVPLNVEVANRSDDADRFEMQVEGIDPEWVAIPEPVFTVGPGEANQVKVFFKPARVSESSAGNYPFVIRVRSLNSGDSRSVQGVVQVKPFHHLSMEINPKKGSISPTRRMNVFTVSIMNLGNTEHTLQLFGNDPEEACTYEFEQEQVSVAPGQQKNLEVEVVPASTGFLSSSRLHGFSISARSIEAPSVMASAQGQLEQRPFVTPWTLIFIVLMALVGVLYISSMPKPPSIEVFAERQDVRVGDQVTIRWQAQNANKVRISLDEEPIYEGALLNGQRIITVDKPGTMRITGVALRDTKSSPVSATSLTSSTPPPVPDPRVEEFDVSPRSIELGDSVTIRYKCNAAVTKAVLSPTGQQLDLSIDRIDLKPDSLGDLPYVLAASNSAGKTVRSRTITIHVTDPTAVKVIVFRYSPKLTYIGGKVTITWQVANAVRVELTDDTSGTESAEVMPSGSKDFLVDKTTVYTLRAWDSKGNPITKTLKVEVPPEPKPDTTGGDPATTTTGTTSGAGTTGATATTTGGGRP